MPKLVWARPIAFIFGGAAVVANCYGVYEYQQKLAAGQIDYLVLSGVLAVIATSMAMALASWAWKATEYAAAIGWGIILCGGFVFLIMANADRVFQANESKSAQVRSSQFAAVRARDALEEAKAKLTEDVVRRETSAKAQPNCDKSKSCRDAIAFAASIRQDIQVAESIVSEKEKLEIKQSGWTPPPWLLPLLLDIIGVFGLKVAFGGAWVDTRISRTALRTLLTPVIQEREKRFPRPVIASGRNYVDPDVAAAPKVVKTT